jgi:hypothetical protein
MLQVGLLKATQIPEYNATCPQWSLALSIKWLQIIGIETYKQQNAHSGGRVMKICLSLFDGL